MAKGRMINTFFWDDSYIISLNPIQKLLFLYLLTNSLTNICGIYQITDKRINFDTGIDVKEVGRILAKLETDKKIKRCGDWLILVNWVEHQSLNPKVIKGIEREILELPEQIKPMIDYDRLSHLTKLNLTKPNLTELNANSEDPTNLYLHSIEESPFANFEVFEKEANEDPEIKRLNADLKYYHNYWVTSCKASKKTSYNWFQEIKRYMFARQFDDNFRKMKSEENPNWK